VRYGRALYDEAINKDHQNYYSFSIQHAALYVAMNLNPKFAL
jgi:hypothetical protein